MPNRVNCEINLGAIQHNYINLARLGQLIPVLKSDAYGHGLIPCAHALKSLGCNSICVGFPTEALQLDYYNLHFDTVIPLMGCLDQTDWMIVKNHNLTPLIHNDHDLYLYQHYNLNNPIALKIDSGMNRLGFQIDSDAEIEKIIEKTKHLPLKFIITHLACGPENPDYTNYQINLIINFHDRIKRQHPEIKLSLNNSANLLNDRIENIHRPGIALYGIALDENVHQRVQLEEALNIWAPLIETRMIKQGHKLSYNCLYTADMDTQTAVIAMGYANGCRREFSQKIKLIINNKAYEQIGAICMNLLMVKLHDQRLQTDSKCYLIRNFINTDSMTPEKTIKNIIKQKNEINQIIQASSPANPDEIEKQIKSINDINDIKDINEIKIIKNKINHLSDNKRKEKIMRQFNDKFDEILKKPLNCDKTNRSSEMPKNHAKISLDQLAKETKTNVYELMCNLGNLNNRFYTDI